MNQQEHSMVLSNGLKASIMENIHSGYTDWYSVKIITR